MLSSSPSEMEYPKMLVAGRRIPDDYPLGLRIRNDNRVPDLPEEFADA